MGVSWMAGSLARMARVLGQCSKVELPAERDQGLGTGIRQRTNRPLEHARGGLLKGGLDIRYLSRHEAHAPGDGSASGESAGGRQALGGSAGLSFMR
jgi:hypothetical protein